MLWFSVSLSSKKKKTCYIKWVSGWSKNKLLWIKGDQNSVFFKRPIKDVWKL